MMDISHLYHDAAFGDPTLELDVKEQLKTREVNAREERNLQRMHRSYDREMDICEKNTAWERWKVGQSLQGIWERSPRLEKRLAMEKARIEALERSILFRNFHRMNTHTSDFSMTSRSVARVALKPLQDHKKTLQSKTNPKKKEKSVRETGDNNNNNNNPSDGNEKGIGRQADFVRRSEHSIKALAKLNWKQQTRRRDHEKFKEDLYFHSKHVFEKAKVILKGRPDIDVENLHTDLESILLPPVKKPVNFNPKPQFKTSNSNLYEKNVLRLGESVQRKHPPYLSPLAPVSENSEPAGYDKNPTTSEQPSAVNDSKHSNNSIPGADCDVHKRLIPADGDSSVTERSDNLSSSNINSTTSVTNGKCDTNSDSENNRLPDLSQTSTSQTNTSKPTCQKSAMAENHQPNTSPPPSNNKGVNTNDFTDSNSNIAPNQNHTEQHHQQQHHQQNVPTPVPSHPFSPSTSISQVIIEENEEDLEKSNATSGDETCPDINNNSMPMHDDQGMMSHNDTGTNSAYTMACTTGLPQIWKQAKKPKEVATPEVSASAIARKHKRKRRDRW